MKKIFLASVSVLLVLIAKTQAIVPDSIYSSNIKTVKLFQQNNQESLPIINLNSADLLELHFDDLDGIIKNYYYTFQLCNANWSVADLNAFDYIKGFTQNRIIQARPSSISATKYVHYQATLPEKNCVPTKSGNYLLKVFLNGDEEQIVFTKRMYVVNNITAIGLQILQPFDNNLYRTHQKIQFSLSTAQLNIYNPQQQLKVAVLQNQRWDNALINVQPTFIRENSYEYNDENVFCFPAGKEYRWLDLRSFRFESDRIASRTEKDNGIDVFVKPEATRTADRYLYMRDMNGWYEITTTELVNNWWQTGYAKVHFTYVPTNNQPYAGKEVYIIGELTNNTVNANNKMEYNAQKGVYEKILYLKQGYYFYQYVTKDIQPKNAKPTFDITEGNYWETENSYAVFVYYKSFNGRHDELVGFTTANSRLGTKLF